LDSKMGNYIASSMAEKQKEVQKEMQKEMQEIQMVNMIRGQERMRRMMIVQQMAMTRERLWWIAAFGTVFTGAVFGYIRHVGWNNFPKPALLSVLTYWYVTCFQYDLAYGSKIERVNKYTNQILQDPSYWFNPVLPKVDDLKPEIQRTQLREAVQQK